MTAMKIVGHKSEQMHRGYNASHTLITPGAEAAGGGIVSRCKLDIGA